jgi:hypothetical protein
MMKNVIQFVRDFPEAQLTGSHFFGNVNSESDVDFFISENGDNPTSVDNRLLDAGFTAELRSFYKGQKVDTNIAQVYYHPQLNIHVQLVRDLALKVAAQNFLRDLPTFPLDVKLNFLNAPKSARRAYWQWANEVVSKQFRALQVVPPAVDLSPPPVAEVRVTTIGKYKIGVIRTVREVTGWDLKEAKEFVDRIAHGGVTMGERILITGITSDEAINIVHKFSEVGAHADWWYSNAA